MADVPLEKAPEQVSKALEEVQQWLKDTWFKDREVSFFKSFGEEMRQKMLDYISHIQVLKGLLYLPYWILLNH